MSHSPFFFGDWQVDASANRLQNALRAKQIEPKAMDVLVYLCRHAGKVVSSEALLNQCWPGLDTGDNPLHKTINQLRRALGDSASQPKYIETIRKRGYRALAEVRFPLGDEQQAQRTHWQGAAPFPGLKAYGPEHAGIFYGRSQQITTLLERVSQQIRFGRDFCLVLGPSGCGKSSLLQAGILPNLQTAQGFHGVGVPSSSTLDLADVGKGLLLLSLASCLLDWDIDDKPALADISAQTLATELATDPAAPLAKLKAALKGSAYRTPRFALVIDRLEVALSSPLFSDDERHQFISLLDTLARSGSVLVLSACRNDFYPQLVSHPSLMAGKNSGAHFDLAPPTRSELLQMIRLPAQAAGLRWDSDTDTATPLDEMLCSDAAHNPDALPMLQHVLQQLYLSRSDDGLMQVSHYHQLGGIEGAIGKTAEDAMAPLTKAQRDALPKVLSLLVTLREDEQSVTSRSARWSQLTSAHEQALVQALVDQRLFVSHLQQGEASFGIAHEALLRRWPRATDWIDKHKAALTQMARLRHQAQRWQQEGRNSAYLLADGKPLQDAAALATNPLFSLDADEMALLSASQGKARRRRWSRRGTLLLLSLLTVTAIGMSYRSQRAEKHATEQRLAAENLLGYMVGQFADKLRGIGRMDLLDGISNKALDYFQSVAGDDSGNIGFAGRFQHGQTLEAIGEVAYSRSKTDEAKHALLTARREFLPLLNAQPDNLALLKSLGANAFWLGQLRYDQADWAGASDWFSHYLTYSQRMYSLAPADGNALMELSYALNSLGSVKMYQLQYSAARPLFERSLALKEQALKQTPNNTQRMADVVDTRSWLASAAIAEGRVTQALRTYEKNRREFPAEHFANNSYMLERLAPALQRQAYLLYLTGQFKQAVAIIKEAAQTAEVTWQHDPKNAKALAMVLSAKTSLLLFCSRSHCADTHAISQHLVSDIRTATATIGQRRATALLGLYYRALAMSGNADSATLQRYLQQSITLYSNLINNKMRPPQVIAGLANSYLQFAQQLSGTGQTAQVQQHCQQALSLLAPLVQKSAEPYLVVPYAQALDCTGKLPAHPQLLAILKKEGIHSDFYTMTRK